MKINIEKFVEKINTIGKIIAFIGIFLSVVIKLNQLFGFYKPSEKKSDKATEEGAE